MNEPSEADSGGPVVEDEVSSDGESQVDDDFVASVSRFGLDDGSFTDSATIGSTGPALASSTQESSPSSASTNTATTLAKSALPPVTSEQLNKSQYMLGSVTFYVSHLRSSFPL